MSRQAGGSCHCHLKASRFWNEISAVAKIFLGTRERRGSNDSWPLDFKLRASLLAYCREGHSFGPFFLMLRPWQWHGMLGGFVHSLSRFRMSPRYRSDNFFSMCFLTIQAETPSCCYFWKKKQLRKPQRKKSKVVATLNCKFVQRI